MSFRQRNRFFENLVYVDQQEIWFRRLCEIEEALDEDLNPLGLSDNLQQNIPVVLGDRRIFREDLRRSFDPAEGIHHLMSQSARQFPEDDDLFRPLHPERVLLEGRRHLIKRRCHLHIFVFQPLDPIIQIASLQLFRRSDEDIDRPRKTPEKKDRQAEDREGDDDEDQVNDVLCMCDVLKCNLCPLAQSPVCHRGEVIRFRGQLHAHPVGNVLFRFHPVLVRPHGKNSAQSTLILFDLIFQMVESRQNRFGMMTAEAAAQRSIHCLHVRHDRIKALSVPGIFEIEVGLCPLEFYQKVFAKDLDPVEPEEIIYFARGLFDGHGNVDPAQKEKEGKDAQGDDDFLFHHSFA